MVPCDPFVTVKCSQCNLTKIIIGVTLEDDYVFNDGWCAELDNGTFTTNLRLFPNAAYIFCSDECADLHHLEQGNGHGQYREIFR